MKIREDKKVKLQSRKIVAILLVFLTSTSLLTGCSSTKTQKATIFIDDATTSGRPINGNLTLKGAESDPIEYALIEKAAKADDDSKKSEKTEWNDECDNGQGCVYLKGKPLSEIEVTDYFESTEGFTTELPINENGKAVLKVADGKFAAEWRFLAKTNEEPIYINLLITDFWVSATELKDGKVTYTPVSPSAITPEHSWYFEELFKDDLSNYFERENPWAQFRLMYQKYSIAKNQANDDTCKIFGKDCDGRASYSKIADAYRNAYDDILTPMLGELSTNNDDKNVAVALLKLEKMAKLLADCYFRSYSAADDRNDNAYSATTECFSDVKQQQSDLEIFLKEHAQDLTGFLRAGTH